MIPAKEKLSRKISKLKKKLRRFEKTFDGLKGQVKAELLKRNLSEIEALHAMNVLAAHGKPLLTDISTVPGASSSRHSDSSASTSSEQSANPGSSKSEEGSAPGSDDLISVELEDPNLNRCPVSMPGTSAMVKIDEEQGTSSSKCDNEGNVKKDDAMDLE